MCTCINLSYKNSHYFGRNMDLDYSFNEKIIIIPKNYFIKLKKEKEIKSHYSFIGIGTIIDNYPLLAEGSNEYGVSIASLNYPLECQYFEFNKDKINVAPYELPLLILSKCKNLNDIKKIINNLNLINNSFNENVNLTPLHFMISYKDKSIVIESNKYGLEIHDNPFNVLTNSPSFNYHKYNLNNYINLNNNFIKNNLNNYNFNDYSYGLGAYGLPGDYSSSSRFIKTYFVKNYLDLNDNNEYNILQFFKCLDSVSMIKNIVKTKDDFEYTRYTSCYINNTLYYKTYYSNIRFISLNDFDLNDNKLIYINLNNKIEIKKEEKT